VDNKIPIRTLPFPVNETKITSANSFTQADFTLTPQQTLTASLPCGASIRPIRKSRLLQHAGGYSERRHPVLRGRPDTSASDRTRTLAEHFFFERYCNHHLSAGEPWHDSSTNWRQGELFCGSATAFPGALNELWSLTPMTGLGMYKVHLALPLPVQMTKDSCTREPSQCLMARERNFARSTLPLEAHLIEMTCNRLSSYKIIGLSTHIWRLMPEYELRHRPSRQQRALLLEWDLYGVQQ
jgi:hypothetical protein